MEQETSITKLNKEVSPETPNNETLLSQESREKFKNDIEQLKAVTDEIEEGIDTNDKNQVKRAIPGFKKAVLGVTMLLSTIGFAKESPKEVSTNLAEKTIGVEADDTVHKDTKEFSVEDLKTYGDPEKSKEAKKEEEGAKKEGKREELKSVIVKEFALGSPELSGEDAERVRLAVEHLLTPENIKLIQENKAAIVLETSVSDMPIRKGGYTYENFNIKTNKDLLLSRDYYSELFVKKVAKEKGLHNPLVTIKHPGGEDGIINEGPYKNKRIFRVSIETSRDKLVENSDYIILDGTGSMKPVADRVKEIVENSRGKIVPLEYKEYKVDGILRDQLEHPYLTALHVARGAKPGSTITVVTNEQSNFGFGEVGEGKKYSTYKERNEAFFVVIKELRQLAKEKHLTFVLDYIDPTNPEDEIFCNLLDAPFSNLNSSGDKAAYENIKKALKYKQTHEIHRKQQKS